jgi:hypothetical protein
MTRAVNQPGIIERYNKIVMILLTIVLLLSLVVFIVAVFSPHKGTRAQHHSQRILNIFLSKIHTWPKWIRAIIDKPPIASHKVFTKSAHLGKATRKKVSKPKEDKQQS